MIIKLLQDNTVAATLSDGSKEVVNSTYSHKSKSGLVRKIADAFPYKGAMDFDAKVPTAMFNTDSATVTAGENSYAPGDDISGESDEVKLFVSILLDNGMKALWQERQKLNKLENPQPEVR